MDKAVIVSAVRTPIGSFLGSLKMMTAVNLGSVVLESALAKAHVDRKDVDEVYMGHVLQGGCGQAPARQASLGAGISKHTPCTTINKVCGSGLKAVMLSADSILLNKAKIVLGAGCESMSNAPYILPKVREGLRLGDARILDLMMHDGLFDPYGQSSMGNFGDICAREYKISRQEQDDYARSSYEKAIFAQNQGFFDSEICGVKIKHKNYEDFINKDEEPQNYKPEKMPLLKPAFNADGTVTAANSSKINDGAAALLLMSEDEAKRRDLFIKARILAYTGYSQDPQWFTTAPIKAIEKVCEMAHIKPLDIGLFEINEAFSVVPLVCIRELNLNPKAVNVFGGAVALGHPIGASGARILVTLINAMHIKKVRFGCAAICLGGGEALAMILERMES